MRLERRLGYVYKKLFYFVVNYVKDGGYESVNMVFVIMVWGMYILMCFKVFFYFFRLVNMGVCSI